jgi:RNA polymerase sigma-70 factor (ECF subfamily)
LAAVQIRRELIDLARHHYGPQGAAAHHHSQAPAAAAQQPAHEAADLSGEPSRLAAWGEFHEQVAILPEEEREVFELIWYQGLGRAEAAALLDVSVKTVQRRWQAACLRLHQALGGSLPEW